MPTTAEAISIWALQTKAGNLSMGELNEEINRLLTICVQPFHADSDEARQKAVVYARVWLARARAYRDRD